MGLRPWWWGSTAANGRQSSRNGKLRAQIWKRKKEAGRATGNLVLVAFCWRHSSSCVATLPTPSQTAPTKLGIKCSMHRPVGDTFLPTTTGVIPFWQLSGWWNVITVLCSIESSCSFLYISLGVSLVFSPSRIISAVYTFLSDCQNSLSLFIFICSFLLPVISLIMENWIVWIYSLFLFLFMLCFIEALSHFILGTPWCSCGAFLVLLCIFS